MLSDLTDALATAFAAYGCPAPVLFGEQFKDENFDGSRVVVCPAKDSFSGKLASYTGATPAGKALRSFATRSQGAEITIFAAAPLNQDPLAQLRADHAALDALVNMTCLALSKVALGVTMSTDGEIISGEAVHVRRGLTYVMSITVDVPLLDVAFPKNAIKPCDVTFTAAQPSYAVTVEELDSSETFTVSPP